MNELLNLDITSIVLTLLAFRVGQRLQSRTKSPICNPILIAVVLVVSFMGLTGLQNASYQAACGRISWLMTPATVCLAIPMYEQLQVLRKNIGAIVAGITAGAISCLVFMLLFTLLWGFDRELTVSLLPKSVTSAIGVPLSTLAGGIASVTTAAIILTGIIAAVLGPALCKLFRLEDPVARGVAFGTSGHVIGTSKANEMSPLTGAVSSLSLVVAGLLTAVVFPLVTALL